MALFDTDVLIDHLRGVDAVRDTILNFKNEKNYCSVITSGEIGIDYPVKPDNDW